MSKPSNLRDVAVSDIRTNPVALRELQREDEKYLNLVDSVSKMGVLLPITVMQKIDDATGETFFQIVDGLHRYSAACDAGLEFVPTSILDITDAEVVETQIVANLLKVDTRPVEYTEALHRMLSMNPLMTVPELASRISQSTTFINQRLQLLKLDGPIAKMVDNGEIKVSNAFALAKLPKEEQHEWTDRAITQQPSEFVPAVTLRAKELAEAKRTGQAAKPAEFVPQPKARKLSELKSEYESEDGVAGPALCAQVGAATAVEGFALGVAWALSLDPVSVQTAKSKYEEGRKMREEEKKRVAAARDVKKSREAAAKAEKARSESGLSDEQIEAEIARQEKEAAEKKAAAEAAKPTADVASA